ncbi:MAG: class I SAM-dependent methyltransferase, partial [Bacteroidetes bacterium]|nr:class I SAM-dependent methyltransferase [Bacteroidota bacterium]
MNPISYILKDPVRFAKHLRIKFLNKKIKELHELDKYFNGKNGLEIGGPSKIFGKEGYIPIYPLVSSVDGVNFSTTTVWENTITAGKTYNYGSKTYGYQFIQDGTDLSPVDSEQYDFVLSSHSLEHIANPLKALNEWLRVLKRGGILVLVLPDKRYTFDHRRPVTKFEHLLQDFQNKTAENDLTHLEEIISLH